MCVVCVWGGVCVCVCVWGGVCVCNVVREVVKGVSTCQSVSCSCFVQ